jgi:hypothetical protein
MNRAKIKRDFKKNFEEEKEIRKKEKILRKKNNDIINEEDIEKEFEINFLRFINKLNKS